MKRNLYSPQGKPTAKHLQQKGVRLSPSVRQLLQKPDYDSECNLHPSHPGAVDAAMRVDEATEAVLNLIDDAFRQQDVEDAEDMAQQGFDALASAWPETRRKAMEQTFQSVIEYRKAQSLEQDVAAMSGLRRQKLQSRLMSAARGALSAARDGHVKSLAVHLHRLLILRDVSVSAGVLHVDLVQHLTEGFAVDLAQEQIRGEIRRIALVDPVEAVSQALAFRPFVAPQYTSILKKVAHDEAVSCLKQAVLSIRAQRRAQHMKTRMGALGYIARMTAAYASGQPLPDDENFRHDAYVQVFRDTIVKAASRRGLHGDDPETVQILRSHPASTPLPWRLLAVLRAAAEGRLSWQSSVLLCREVMQASLQVATPKSNTEALAGQ